MAYLVVEKTDTNSDIVDGNWFDETMKNIYRICLKVSEHQDPPEALIFASVVQTRDNATQLKATWDSLNNTQKTRLEDAISAKNGRIYRDFDADIQRIQDAYLTLSVGNRDDSQVMEYVKTLSRTQIDNFVSGVLAAFTRT